MILRIIYMLNNFYKDQTGSGESQQDGFRDSNGNALGEYCAFGYFDALHVVPAQKYQLQSEKNIWEALNKLSMMSINGQNSRRVLSCLTEFEDLDSIFWENANYTPFLFTSFIRIKKNAIAKTQDIMYRLNTVQSSKYDAQCITYLTNDHSEIVLFLSTKSFNDGMSFIADLSAEHDILKKYTIFAAREDALSAESELHQCIAEEMVDCRMKAVIKDWTNLNDFLKKLSEELGISQNNIRHYRILGSKDMTIEIDDVEIRKILILYKMDKLLTHTNKSFGDTFYNIESQFLVKEREQDDRELDSNSNATN